MTLLTTLNAIGSVSVGASATYPVISSRCTDRVLGPEGQNAEAYRELVWELTCHAFADTPGDIGELQETLRAELVRRGVAVTFTDKGEARVMPAGGAVSGSLPGYPIVELTDDPAKTFGDLLTFTLKATTRIPNDDADLVEHDYERTEQTDSEGLLSISQRGTVRTLSGVAARAYAQTNFIDAEETAATTAGQDFTIRWTETADTTIVTYELTRNDPSQDTGTPGVSEAQVTDRTIKQLDGRRIRRISGYAVGDSAQTYVDAQLPTTSSTNILVREESTAPTIPDGKINFLYELLTGVEDAQFPGITIYRFTESIEGVSGGRDAFAGEYLGRSPLLKLGVERAYVYRQSVEIEFMGDWDSHGLTPLLSADNYASPPRIRKSGGESGLRRVSASFVFIFSASQPLPDPRQIEGLT